MIRDLSRPIRHYSLYTLMFDWSLEPRSQLAMLCLLTAFVFWNHDALFFAFATMAAVTRLAEY